MKNNNLKNNKKLALCGIARKVVALASCISLVFTNIAFAANMFYNINFYNNETFDESTPHNFDMYGTHDKSEEVLGDSVLDMYIDVDGDGVVDLNDNDMLADFYDFPSKEVNNAMWPTLNVDRDGDNKADAFILGKVPTKEQGTYTEPYAFKYYYPVADSKGGFKNEYVERTIRIPNVNLPLDNSGLANYFKIEGVSSSKKLADVVAEFNNKYFDANNKDAFITKLYGEKPQGYLKKGCYTGLGKTYVPDKEFLKTFLPTWHADMTKKDWYPTLNIDYDNDGIADFNIDTDGDLVADMNLLNFDSDKDGIAEMNLDTNGDFIPDVNIRLNPFDTKPSLNLDYRVGANGVLLKTTNKNAAFAVDEKGNPKAIFNIDIDRDGKPDKNETNKKNQVNKILNVTTNNEPWPTLNIDINGDGAADLFINVSGSDKENIPEVAIDTTGDGIGDKNPLTENSLFVNEYAKKDGLNLLTADLYGRYKPNKNIVTDDGYPRLNIYTNVDGEGKYKNIDLDHDGIPEIAYDVSSNWNFSENPCNKVLRVLKGGKKQSVIFNDTDEDGYPIYNIDKDNDNVFDMNIRKDELDSEIINFDPVGSGYPLLNIDYTLDANKDMDELKPLCNIDIDGDNKPDVNLNFISDADKLEKQKSGDILKTKQQKNIAIEFNYNLTDEFGNKLSLPAMYKFIKLNGGGKLPEYVSVDGFNYRIIKWDFDSLNLSDENLKKHFKLVSSEPEPSLKQKSIAPAEDDNLGLNLLGATEEDTEEESTEIITFDGVDETPYINGEYLTGNISGEYVLLNVSDEVPETEEETSESEDDNTGDNQGDGGNTDGGNTDGGNTDGGNTDDDNTDSGDTGGNNGGNNGGTSSNPSYSGPGGGAGRTNGGSGSRGGGGAGGGGGAKISAVVRDPSNGKLYQWSLTEGELIGPFRNETFAKSEKISNYKTITDPVTSKITLKTDKDELMRGFYKLNILNTEKYMFADMLGTLYSGWVRDIAGDFYYFDGAKGGEMVLDCTMNIDGYEFKFNKLGALEAGLDNFSKHNYPVCDILIGEWGGNFETKQYTYTFRDSDMNPTIQVKDEIICIRNKVTGNVDRYYIGPDGYLKVGPIAYGKFVLGASDKADTFGLITGVAKNDNSTLPDRVVPELVTYKMNIRYTNANWFMVMFNKLLNFFKIAK